MQQIVTDYTQCVKGSEYEIFGHMMKIISLKKRHFSFFFVTLSYASCFTHRCV